MTYIDKMEKITGKKFGDKENPLLVSVRSGARASMPGMMDTILNLGLNETVVNTIAAKSNNPRWAWDCYRRFIQMFSDVVMEVGKKYFEKLIDEMKEKKGITQDVELSADDLKTLANQFKAEYKKQLGKSFPDDPRNSSSRRSKRYSVRGTTPVRTSTVWITTSLTAGVLRSTCR
jgi:pyruvate,orthophosphate dikinase